ncbi:hypothetical protein SAMN04488038_10783 [Solimonas aquatica]|uniref:Uncharacterized protein n=1 Tax=Solimonas aquatica TaxID=489703 RepID=A0A1H9GI30_9GAMM|nr:hypothetical protein SAMN04488038_10783 [Solimonas aquatica]
MALLWRDGLTAIPPNFFDGTYEEGGEVHLQRYTNDFDFRWDNRIKLGVNDVWHTDKALRGADGKHFIYRQIKI